MSRFARGLAVGWGGVCLLLTVLFIFQLSDLLSTICLGVVGIGSIAAIVVGPTLHRPESVLPWRLIAVAATFFLVSVVLPEVLPQTGTSALTIVAVSLIGYTFLIAGLVALTRAGGPLERNALADGIIVTLGAGLLAAVTLALPITEVTTRPYIESLFDGLYPVIDVVLLQLLLNLAFTTAVRLPSYRWNGLGLICLLIGDLTYAWINRRSHPNPSPLYDLPYMLAYTCLGFSAFHPSMAEISRSVPRPIQAWSRFRLLIITPALLVPGLLSVLAPPRQASARWLVAVVYTGMVLTLVFRAVTAVRGLGQAQEVLRHRAAHDTLTDLPNRLELAERLRRLQAGGRAEDPPLWVLFLDLDGFKFINDTWGHEIGDRLLVEVASRLRRTVGALGTVSRVGGDEFVIGGRMGRDQVVGLAGRIQEVLRRPFSWAGLDLVVSTSIGMTEGGPGDDVPDLFRDADAAMYRAKSSGRDTWRIFDEGMRASVRDRAEIEIALRYAVAREQLWVAYQPIVDLYTGQAVGAEALLRWEHPERGPIPPDEVIPIAEETGLIVEIGAWVMTQSVRQLVRWREEGVVGPEFYVSVNASTRQLRDQHLRELAADLLAETGLPGSCLVLEITESVMMHRSHQASELLAGLRELEIGLSVDDFGTGYSSLSYLSQYPLTGVKVDRAFVRGLGEVPQDAAIVRAIAAMATALDLAVVAEGVETPGQRDLLRQMGIRYGQGWLWGRPVAPDNFATAWSTDHRPEGTPVLLEHGGEQT